MVLEPVSKKYNAWFIRNQQYSMFSGLYSIYLHTSVLPANPGSRTGSNSIFIYIDLLPELAGNTDVYK